MPFGGWMYNKELWETQQKTDTYTFSFFTVQAQNRLLGSFLAEIQCLLTGYWQRAMLRVKQQCGHACFSRSGMLLAKIQTLLGYTSGSSSLNMFQWHRNNHIKTASPPKLYYSFFICMFLNAWCLEKSSLFKEEFEDLFISKLQLMLMCTALPLISFSDLFRKWNSTWESGISLLIIIVLITLVILCTRKGGIKISLEPLCRPTLFVHFGWFNSVTCSLLLEDVCTFTGQT